MKACYIHVPFCKEICAYCDFVRCRYQKQIADKWLHRILADIDAKLSQNVESIYIGGGTPTALSDSQFSSLLQKIEPYTVNCTEYTIEANPDSLNDEKIALLEKSHVNRISLGVQTFQPLLQEIIARKHCYSEIEQLLARLHQHQISNISIDLMYGLPEQTMAMWKEDLRLAVSLPISHISLYSLTIEEHSKFGREGIRNMDAQEEADMYEFAISYLKEHGFLHYEISNFAKAGKGSKHNLAYWNYDDFIGIGCGASGKEQHERYDNTKNIHTYIMQGACPTIISLQEDDEQFEMLMMSLRKSEGLDLIEFGRRFNIEFLKSYQQSVKKNIEKGFLIIKDNHLQTTYQGMLVLNDVLIDFM